MKNKLQPTKVLKILTILLLIAAALYYSKNYKNTNQPKNDLTPKILYVQKFENNKISPYLPKDILKEKEINILENKLVVYEKNIQNQKIIETKSILKLISNNSKKNNEDFYINYLNQNFWEIERVKSDSDYFILIGKKPQDKEVIQIIITNIPKPDGADIYLSGSQIEIVLTKIHNQY